MHHYLHLLKQFVLHWPLWTYWNPAELLNSVPPALWPWMREYIALIAILLIGALISVFVRLPGKLNDRFGTLCWNNVWIGGLLYFFRYQHVPILGMDIWRLLQEVAIVIWLYVIVNHFRRTYPQERLDTRIAEYRGRYLPKPKVR